MNLWILVFIETVCVMIAYNLGLHHGRKEKKDKV